jgi:hypothetical protein
MSDDRKHPREVETAAEQVPGQPSQRRRRLVKGALSAPVFLTLQNGSVFANTSNDALLATGVKDAKVHQDLNGDPYLQCVIPGEGAGQDGEKFDFGSMYRCPKVYIETDDEGNLLKQAAYDQCTGYEQNQLGGYIVAGSAHASLCH